MIRYVDEIEISGKRVFLRVDFNVLSVHPFVLSLIFLYRGLIVKVLILILMVMISNRFLIHDDICIYKYLF